MLSPREIEVTQLIADGMTDREIGEKLDISHKTVSTHRKEYIEKAGVEKHCLIDSVWT
ncbi:MAG: helix-turn-helix transcriptional regulator [Bacteroidetes bacterium]|nr:helix-turn-helix transcriptional regulator [Bacteroidota bacterium]